MDLTRIQIQKMAGKAIFLRGEDYYLRRMVRSLAWEGRYVRADVQGSSHKPYKVTVALAGGVPVVRCTCPYDWGGLCKHGVAVLLYLIDQDKNDSVEVAGIDSFPRARYPISPKRTGKKVIEAEPADSALKDFLRSAYDAPKLQLMLTVKGLRVSSDKGVPFSLGVSYQGRLHQITDIGAFLEPDRHTLNDHLPSITACSNGQENFLKMIREFLHGTGSVYSQRQWRLQPFQLSALLDAACCEDGIEIVEPLSSRKYSLRQEPLVGLKVMVRLTQKGKVGVTALLVHPSRSGQHAQLGDVFSGSRSWLFDEEALDFYLMDSRIDPRFLVYFLNIERVLSSDERQHFLAGVLPKLKAFADVVMDDPKAHALRVETVVPRPCYMVDAGREGLSISLAFDYAGNRIGYSPEGTELYVEGGVGDDRVLIRRDMAREDALARSLIDNYGCVFDDRSGCYFVVGPEAIFDFFSVQAHCLAQDGDVYWSDKAKALYREDAVVRPRVIVSNSGIDWFAYDVAYTLAGKDIDSPQKVIHDHLSFGRKFVRLKTGEFVKLDAAAFTRVAGLMDGRDHKGKFMLAHIPFIMDELEAAGIAVETDSQTRELYDELKSFKGIDAAAIPASVDGVLRDYQRHGVSWLAFLKKFRFGGILADEMGLGKTLQALTMIQHDIEAGCVLPSLIVCPTTLVWNWEAEIRKFLPKLKIVVIGGKDRFSQLQEIPQSQIVITSYALLRRDIEKYHQYRFHYLILDEAQNIKNRHTINARVAKQLNSECRLALTGTPLENSVADIWSIFDFLMPFFLGNYERFRASYEIPITQFQDAGKLKELSRRIAPFVLRRLKQDVIKELPEKIEQTSFCELEPAQARLYAMMAQKARKEAAEAYQAKGFQRSRMLILTLLLRLRQICCHPELSGVRLKHRIGVSAKTDLLKETLRELLSSGHRVLVFSQFVEMLGIIRDHLDREKVVYEYMDGQARDRQKRVERFNNDPSVKVFLLSLKVGGLGLNLTSADTVILYEPWWNPAVEQQAIDRTHRIGQKNVVLAYHLIARGTIEEKILELQKRKNFLMSSLVLSEEGISKKLDWEDIKFLLGFDDVANAGVSGAV